MKKKIIIIVTVLIIVCLSIGIYFISTNNKENTNNEKDNNNKTEKKEEKKVNIIDVNSKTRPYAVMINCHNSALPQAGLDKAYIVYELMVEGGITRMMALFKDVDVAKIGSSRSARIQFLDYVYENDAIYAHAGGAKDAIERIRNEKISDVDVDGKYGMRDKTLNRAYEHTLFTSTDLLKKGTEAKGYSKTTKLKNLLTYSAEEIDTSKIEGSSKANNVSIKYSSYRTSNYVYDETSKTYLRSMNDTKDIDLVTNEQYRVKNIIAYSVEYENYTHHGYSAYVKTNNVGTGEGVYISNGYSIPIIWTKSSKNEQTKYTIKSTGEELVVNDGNTYIQIYPTSGKLTIE